VSLWLFFSMRTEYIIELSKRRLAVGERTLVMGILNVTPDSFSDGGQYLSRELAVERALAIEAEGADILDIGGESSRPGADLLSAQEEMERVLPVIESLKGRLKIPISIDTTKSQVAAAAIAAGAEMINDISGLRFDEKMGEVAARSGAAICLMHMRGTPKTMQKLSPSPDIWSEVERDLEESVSSAVRSGIEHSRLIIDPGIGFGKTLDDNLEIIARLERLDRFHLPVLIGTSRKSFIGRLLARPETDRLMGTAASVAASILLGAHIVRVHDVAPMVDVARIADAILSKGKRI
jgi:dihydropteroate synthase